MNPVGFIYRIGTMCSVQQESGAFSSDRNSAAEDSIKTLIVYTLIYTYIMLYLIGVKGYRGQIRGKLKSMLTQDGKLSSFVEVVLAIR